MGFVLTTQAELTGNVYTNSYADVSQSSKLTGNLQAGAYVAVNSATLTGNVHASDVVALEVGGTIEGNVVGNSGLSVQTGGKITGTAVTRDGANIGDGVVEGGATTSSDVQPPPPVASLQLSADLARAATYFKEKSLEWANQPSCIVDVVILQSEFPEQNFMSMTLHSRVNYLNGLPVDLIGPLTRVRLLGNPEGVLIWSIPGATFPKGELKDLAFVQVDKSGNEVPIVSGRVLLNFYEATAVTLSEIQLKPDLSSEPVPVSILAPLAVIKDEGTVLLKGNVIGKSFVFSDKGSRFGVLPFGLHPKVHSLLSGSVTRTKAACLWHTL